MTGLLIAAVICLGYFILGRPIVMVIAKVPDYRSYAWTMPKLIAATVFIASNLLAGAAVVVCAVLVIVFALINH